MRNILAILALFVVCTSICLGGQTITVDRNVIERPVGWDEMHKQRDEDRNECKRERECLIAAQIAAHKVESELNSRVQRLVRDKKWLQRRVEWDKEPLHRYRLVNLVMEWNQKWLQLMEERMVVLAWVWDQVSCEHELVQQKKWLRLMVGQMVTCDQEELVKLVAEWNQHDEEHELVMKQHWERLDAKYDERWEWLDVKKKENEKEWNEWDEHRQQWVCPDIAGNGYSDNSNSANYGKALNDVWNNPNNNRLTINPYARVGNAYGAKMNKASVDKDGAFVSMTDNEVIVNGGEFGCGSTEGDIAGAFAATDIAGNMNVSSNTVRIMGGIKIGNVYGGHALKGTVSSNTVTIGGVRDVAIGGSVHGGYISINGTATLNKVNLTSVTVTKDVYGAKFEKGGYASSNTVTITGGRVGGDVIGAYANFNGTATGNTVKLTDVFVKRDVYGGKIFHGLASSNTVTITDGIVGENVYGGYIFLSGYIFLGRYIFFNGTAIENTVNMTNVIVNRDVYGARIGERYGSGLASQLQLNVG